MNETENLKLFSLTRRCCHDGIHREPESRLPRGSHVLQPLSGREVLRPDQRGTASLRRADLRLPHGRAQAQGAEERQARQRQRQDGRQRQGLRPDRQAPRPHHAPLRGDRQHQEQRLRLPGAVPRQPAEHAHVQRGNQQGQDCQALGQPKTTPWGCRRSPGQRHDGVRRAAERSPKGHRPREPHGLPADLHEGEALRLRPQRDPREGAEALPRQRRDHREGMQRGAGQGQLAEAPHPPQDCGPFLTGGS